MRHLSEHHRLKIHALSPVLSETGRIFLRNAMEQELNKNRDRNNRAWLVTRLKSAGAGRDAAIAVFDDFVNKGK